MPEIVFVALGSNLADPLYQVQQGCFALQRLSHVQYIRSSSLYKTAPWGVTGQPDFVNAVVQLQTALSPQALLEALLHLEKVRGRARSAQRWGPRILDCDILLYGDQVISEAGLVIPHPYLADRPFVLAPLVEIAPHWQLPCGNTVSDLVARYGIDRLPLPV